MELKGKTMLIRNGFAVFCLFIFFAGCQSDTFQNKIVKSQGQTRSYDIRDFGAKGDGESLDTAAIQAAIDACGRNGGGVVVVPAGRYVTGTIKLKSKVTLEVAEGGEILGSKDLADYATDIQDSIEAPKFSKCLIYAENAEDITICGQGVIDGRGLMKDFPVKLDGELQERPMLMRFVECRDIKFEDITLKDAASWCVHLVSCEKIRVDNVKIDSMVNHNNDGFDLDGCEDIVIENSHIVSGDDSICPKSTTGRLTKNMLVKNCRVSSNTAAFKCGTSSAGGFKDIVVTDCVFYDCRMGCIKLLMVDGGVLEDIEISNIKMENVEGPLFIRLGNRGRVYNKPTEQVYEKDVRSEGAAVGKVRNVKIYNIQATVKGSDKARQGMMISGVPGYMVEDVLLEDIEISFSGGGTAEDARLVVAEDEARYPEQFFFGVLPSYGLYLRHAKGITLDNVRFELQSEEKRPAIVCDDVENIEITGFEADGSKADSLIRIIQGRKIFIRESSSRNKMPIFVKVEGDRSSDINLVGNDLGQAEKMVVSGSDVNPDTVTVE